MTYKNIDIPETRGTVSSTILSEETFSKHCSSAIRNVASFELAQWWWYFQLVAAGGYFGFEPSKNSTPSQGTTSTLRWRALHLLS